MSYVNNLHSIFHLPKNLLKKVNPLHITDKINKDISQVPMYGRQESVLKQRNN